MDIRIIQYLHDLILKAETGSPKKLAEELGLSERSVYNYILYMKNEMGAPIRFQRQKNSYVYTENCTFVLKHCKSFLGD
jgi:transcriptional antiterminator